MSRSSQNVTKPNRDAAIMLAIASGSETHETIAKRLNVSRQTVSRVAVEHRAELNARAAVDKAAAVDGPARARQMAADATPDAIEYARGVMNGTEDLSDAAIINVRLAAARLLLDRGGVPAKADLNHNIDVTPDKLERVMAMARLLAS